MKRILFLLFMLLSGPAVAQIPGGDSVAIDKTPVIGGTASDCLYVTSANKVGNQACGGAPSGAAGGALIGTYPNPTIAASASLTTPVISSTTIASLPAAGTAGKIVRVSNAGANGALYMDNGSKWKPLQNTFLLKTLDQPVAGTVGTEVIMLQYQFPAGLWQVGDVLRLWTNVSKSGTTTTCIGDLRAGANGTTGDTAVFSITQLTAGAHQFSGVYDIQLFDATHLQLLNNFNGYGSGGTTTAFGSQILVPNATTTGFFITLSLISGATDVCTQQPSSFQYLGGTN
jgi:hypothetical protein